MSNSKYRQFHEQAKKSPHYWATNIVTDFAVLLENRIDELGITQKALAEKAGVKPSYLSRVMLAQNNVTALTMANLALAVDMKVSVGLSPIAGCDEVDVGTKFYDMQSEDSFVAINLSQASIKKWESLTIRSQPAEFNYTNDYANDDSYGGISEVSA